MPLPNCPLVTRFKSTGAHGAHWHGPIKRQQWEYMFPRASDESLQDAVKPGIFKEFSFTRGDTSRFSALWMRKYMDNIKCYLRGICIWSNCRINPSKVWHISISACRLWLIIISNLSNTNGPFYQHGLNITPAWKVLTYPAKRRMKLLIHSQTSTDAALKFGNG